MTAVKRISPEEAQQLLAAGYVYVDVRSAAEFEAGHPAGARNIPLLIGPGRVDPAFVQKVAAEFPPEAKLVIGCAAGVRSLYGAKLLLGAGFTDVVDQRAGFEGAASPDGASLERGWRALRLPVEYGPDPKG